MDHSSWNIPLQVDTKLTPLRRCCRVRADGYPWFLYFANLFDTFLVWITGVLAVIILPLIGGPRKGSKCDCKLLRKILQWMPKGNDSPETFQANTRLTLI